MFGSHLLQELADVVQETQVSAEDFQSLLIARKIGTSPNHSSVVSACGNPLKHIADGRSVIHTVPNLGLLNKDANPGVIRVNHLSS